MSDQVVGVAPRTASLVRRWYVVAAVLALVMMVLAIQYGSDWLLNFLHVMTGALWTGIDLFMGFVVGPVLKRLPLEARRAVISGLVPRTLFLMPTVSIITSTTGWFLAKRMGFLDVGYPGFHWVIAALVIVTILTIQGTGILLPTNLRLYFELQKPNPDSAKIGRWMRWFVGWWRSRARCKSRYSLSWQSSRPGSSALPHLDEIFLEEIVPKLRQVQCAKVERHPRASARICQFVGLHFRSAHRPETQ